MSPKNTISGDTSRRTHLTWEMMPNQRAFLLTSLSLLVGFWIVFVVYIQFPQTLNFEEFHYIPSARQWLQLVENRNFEHPPLAKQLIALGIAVFGDRPIGWRFMSTLFGALTVLGTYAVALALFRSQLSALFAALLTGLNGLVYVQSRIAMLDTFMMAFLIWSMAFGLSAFFPLYPSSDPTALRNQKIRNLNLSGVLIGLACACKWFAIIPWVALISVTLLYKLFQKWGVRFAGTQTNTILPSFYPMPASGISFLRFAVAWILLPIAAYYCTFLPFLWITKSDGTAFTLGEILFQMQHRMYDGQLRVVTAHPYSSKWFQWPLMTRPIWYLFEASADKQWVRGVILLCNPLVIWGGLAAMLWTLWDWIESRTFAAFWIAGTYLALTFSWAIIPRKIAFFYYYYPSAILLSFAWAYVLHRNTEELKAQDSPRLSLIIHAAILAVALILFVYFLPILSAWKIPFSSYRDWMWLRSWI